MVDAEDGGSPRYALLEAARCIWQGRADDAIALLEELAGRMPPAVESIRLRYLATAYHLAGRTRQASDRAEAARHAAHQAGDVEEEVRAKSLLGRIAVHASTEEDHEAAITLLRQCVRACDEGVVVDDLFHFGCLVDLGVALGNRGQTQPALAALERAISLSASFISDHQSLAELYNGMAEARLARGDLDSAVMYKQKCVQVHEELALRGRITAAFDHAMRLSGERAGRQAASP